VVDDGTDDWLAGLEGVLVSKLPWVAEVGWVWWVLLDWGVERRWFGLLILLLLLDLLDL
jgi:hypothetical protein